MLIVFSSSQDADVLMLEPVAMRLLEVIGKPSAQGILEGEALLAALQTLQAAIEQEQIQLVKVATTKRTMDDDDDERSRGRAQNFVSLKQRAYPLLNLLKHAHEKSVAVTWGTK